MGSQATIDQITKDTSTLPSNRTISFLTPLKTDIRSRSVLRCDKNPLEKILLGASTRESQIINTPY